MAVTGTESLSTETGYTRTEKKGRNLTKRNYSPGRNQDCSGTDSMAGTGIVEYGNGTEPRKRPEFNGTGTTVPVLIANMFSA